MPVSLVTTVWNDLEGCRVFIRQMSLQTQFPAEIAITDAGSTDGTWEYLQSEVSVPRPWKLLLLQESRCNVARGRNLAIAAAGFDIIASTDIGCEWDPEWLEELVEPLLAQPESQMVAGSWGVKLEGLNGPWALTEWAMKGGKHEFVAEPVTYASSRSIAYRRSVWEKVGGYAEDLTLAGDDTVFALMMKVLEIRADAAPRIRCYWHRHDSLRGFLKENFRNFIGAGEAKVDTKHCILVGGRLLTEFAFFCIGIIGIALGWDAIWIFLVFMPLLLSLLARNIAWMRAVLILERLHVSHPYLRVVVFDTLFRLEGLRGYLIGWWRGMKQCQKVRMHLKQLRQSSN